MRFIKPLDETMIAEMAASHAYLVTLEDSAIAAGAGSAVLESLNRQRIQIPVLRLGLADFFPSQGNREQVLDDYGLNQEGLKESILAFTDSR